MKIDAHQHFWKYDSQEYEWIDENKKVIKRDFFTNDLADVQNPLGFEGSIAVQARQSLKENDFLLRLAEKDERIRGVVGWVDLRSPDVDRELEQYYKHPKFVGVRHVVQDEPDDLFMVRENFMRGIQRLHAYKLTYDILTFPKQLPAAIQLVKAFPDQLFVLDHISKPFIKDSVISPWDDQIRQLASFENVYCKLSGMVTEADWQNWKPEDFRPYLDIVLEAFGSDRLMIGSDWPVCLLAGEYEAVMNLVIEYIQSLSNDEQAAILGGNCARFYEFA